MRFNQTLIYLLLFFSNYLLRPDALSAQPPEPMNGAELLLALQKVNVVGSVLYVAAHPDDENTALLAYFSKGKKVRTGYLAITRGSGGQNLIGSEKDDALSILRTQELLAARKIDGAEQFFTRAVDFGYSKSAQESLLKWDEEKILADMVWIIRMFKPDVIITRFSPERGGHGHHTASAILARSAFIAAADPQRFPEQLSLVQTWQARRLVWNGWMQEQASVDSSGNPIVSIDMGEYNPVLGKSYMEIAAMARSMHKSQGFGSAAMHGSLRNHFLHTAGETPAQHDLFDGIDLSWHRVPGGEKIGALLAGIEKKFNPARPDMILPDLLAVYVLMKKYQDNHYARVKIKELERIIQSCSGLWLEAISPDYSITAGDTLFYTCTLVNRSRFPIMLSKIEVPLVHQDSSFNVSLQYNQPRSIKLNYILPVSVPVSYPYWLKGYHGEDIYPAGDQNLTGLPVQADPLQVRLKLLFNDIPVSYDLPVVHRWADRVKGELYRQVSIAPAVTANLNQSLLLFPNRASKKISLLLKSWKKNAAGYIKLNLPDTWHSEPESTFYKFSGKFDEQEITFVIHPGDPGISTPMQIQLWNDGLKSSNSYSTISYDHFPTQLFFPAAEVRLASFPAAIGHENIGYIMGSGDEIPDCLNQLGYQVTLLSDEDLQQGNLSGYDVVITGTRAYNTRTILQMQGINGKLFDYVEQGGTLITLHNTRFGIRAEHIGPYPLKISDARVSREDAPVVFLQPDHLLLNWPNKITDSDFDHWVQERGLYFADDWDGHYAPILSSSDPGEKQQHGGLLYTSYGKGHYIYSGYAWFRQLPAGVPGAYRLFINLISIGTNESQK
jgi:LmbE family N-acetylglucosaminyl deacetylase